MVVLGTEKAVMAKSGIVKGTVKPWEDAKSGVMTFSRKQRPL